MPLLKSLFRVIVMEFIKRNKQLYILATTLRTVALLCATGPIMQTFLASLGFSSQWIYINTSIVQAANVLTISLCSTWADKGSVIKRTAMVELPFALLYLCYIPLCLWKSASLASFLILTAICLLQSVCIALWTICEYKLPYFIYSPVDYGSVLAVSGVISSLISLGTGVVITRLTSFLSYSRLMLVSCGISTVLMLLCALLHRLLKPIPGESPAAAKTPARKKSSPLEIFRYPVFYHLIAANLLRGFGYGTTTIMAAIALDLGFDQSVSTSLVAIQSIALLLGCALFGVGIHHISPRVMAFAGALTFSLMPLMLVRKKVVFLILLAVILLGRTLVDYAVPSILRFAVPVDLAGPFNAWRMLLHNTGSFIATTVAAFIPVEWLLIITMVFQILSGISFFVSKDLRMAPEYRKK